MMAQTLTDPGTTMLKLSQFILSVAGVITLF
ncbi:hypothetical protein V144x_50640 [Gimesia aquarii]|uniref:Uncharacterized protein n=1 Tax=Gimesia aquarii TaxID=2527964 RepID=A0A517W2R7_9PLAN|nr:hypothetical protein V144x_50640 [Gimesia aquarii]